MQGGAPLPFSSPLFPRRVMRPLDNMGPSSGYPKRERLPGEAEIGNFAKGPPKKNYGEAQGWRGTQGG